MAEEPQDKKSALDKIIMGAIIGTAIGSALGASMAPKPGKETREVIKGKLFKVSKEAEEVGSLTKETLGGFFRLAKHLVFGRPKKKEELPMKKIPLEPSELPSQTLDQE
jgi:gas vesicle protein